MLRKIHEEVLCDPDPIPSPPPVDPECGYKRCCPTVRVFEDGSVELTDDDAEIGSVGTIKLRPEVAKRFVEILQGR